MHDALVVGGGPAGSVAALALARAGWNVALVEKAAFPRPKVCGEYISAGTWPLLVSLGVSDDLLRDAGPPVEAVGFFAGEAMVTREMPRPRRSSPGRALGREALDARLLDAARRAGAAVHQPYAVTSLDRDARGFHVCARERGGRTVALEARLVVAAHGSWEPGTLPTQPVRLPPVDSDLLGFKAHFHGGRLAPGLMPLVLFPGGYGGLVHTGHGRIGFSCCIRRDGLSRVRAGHPGLCAGDAVLAHAMRSCAGLREVLAKAARPGRWLSAGPIRPGMRPLGSGGLFAVGNAAGEAHPLVAEGIGMAVQSASLLAEALLRHGERAWLPEGRRDVERDYAHAWRSHFAGRIRAAEWFARLSLDRSTLPVVVAALTTFPAMLATAARFSGKARPAARLAP